MVAALRTVVDRHDHNGRRSTGVERIDLDHNESPADQHRGTNDRPDVDREALADALGVGPRRRSGRPRGPST
jgi:hypothetical protein